MTTARRISSRPSSHFSCGSLASYPYYGASIELFCNLSLATRYLFTYRCQFIGLTVKADMPTVVVISRNVRERFGECFNLECFELRPA